MNKTRQITEAGLFAALIAIMIVGAYYLPIIGGVLAFLLPVPVIVLTMKNKPLYVFVAGVIASLISGAIISIINGLTLGGLALIIGLPMGLAIKNKKSNLMTLFVGTVSAAIGLFIIFTLLEFVFGVSFISVIEDSFRVSMDLQSSLGAAASDLGVDTTASLDELQKAMDQLLYITQLVMPALMIAMAMLYSAINLLVSHQVLKRMKIDHLPLGTFDTFRYPKHLAYGSMGMLFLAYIISYLGYVDSELLMSNLMYLFITVFSVQGYALLYAFFKKRTGKSMSIILLVLLTLFGFTQFIAFLGFFDVMMDLRRLDIKIKKD